MTDKYFKCKDGCNNTIYERLYSFYSEITQHTYIIFTDNNSDLNGNIRILFGILSDVSSSEKGYNVYSLLPVQSEIDFKIISSVWKNQLMGGNIQ